MCAMQKYKEKLPVELGELTEKVSLFMLAQFLRVVLNPISPTEPHYALLGGMHSGFAVGREKTEARPILVTTLIQ